MKWTDILFDEVPVSKLGDMTKCPIEYKDGTKFPVLRVKKILVLFYKSKSVAQMPHIEKSTREDLWPNIVIHSRESPLPPNP